MSSRLPLKNLVKLNWVLSAMIATLVFIYFQALVRDFAGACSRSLQNLVFMLAVSFFNLILLRVAERELLPGLRCNRFIFLVFSYSGAFIIWLIIRSFYSFITGRPWEGEGVHVVEAYLLATLAISVINTLILVMQNMTIIEHRKVQAEIENLQLQANISETANLLLRQQIHPHFLFNALNTIKSLYKKDLQQGEEYLVHLANFLRASISNHYNKTTLIKNELELCDDYLKMQKIRFGIALNFSISIAEQTVKTGYLPCFSLQPLIENALKHNDLTEELPISISITEEEGYLLVANNLQPRSYKEPSTGQGLLNLTKRYQLLGEDDIVIARDNGFFTVRIKILDK